MEKFMITNEDLWEFISLQQDERLRPSALTGNPGLSYNSLSGKEFCPMLSRDHFYQDGDKNPVPRNSREGGSPESIEEARQHKAAKEFFSRLLKGNA